MSDRTISIDAVAEAMRFDRPPRDALELLGWLRAYGLDPEQAATLAQAAELSAERLSEEHIDLQRRHAALVERVHEMERMLAGSRWFDETHQPYIAAIRAVVEEARR